ncbi:hypothetical protein [Microbacterium aurum]
MADTKSGFSADERAAMKQRAEELRATKGLKGAAKLAKELEACVEAIEALTGVDGDLARAVHRIVGDVAPHLNPKTFYGFPAYAVDGKVVLFVQPASKFDTRYPTLNFDEPGAPRRRTDVAGLVRGGRGDGCRREAHPRPRRRGGGLNPAGARRTGRPRLEGFDPFPSG